MIVNNQRVKGITVYNLLYHHSQINYIVQLALMMNAISRHNNGPQKVKHIKTKSDEKLLRSDIFPRKLPLG